MEPSFCTELELFEDSTIMVEDDEDILKKDDIIPNQLAKHDYLHPHYHAVLDECSVSSRDEDSHFTGNQLPLPQPQPPLCFRSKLCLLCVYLLLTVLMLSSFVSVVVVAIVVASSYHKVASFVCTQCTTVQSLFSQKPDTCSCGKGCSSHHTCLQVLVEFVVDDLFVQVSALAENEATLHRQCSYYPPCTSSQSDNNAAVFAYQEQYGLVNNSFQCSYNPSNPAEVMRDSRFKLQHVLHGITWPLITFFISLSLLIFLARRKGWSFF